MPGMILQNQNNCVICHTNPQAQVPAQIYMLACGCCHGVMPNADVSAYDPDEQDKVRSEVSAAQHMEQNGSRFKEISGNDDALRNDRLPQKGNRWDNRGIMVTTEEFREIFPVFRNSDNSFLSELLAVSSQKTFPAGVIIYSEGDSCSAIAFLLSGEIRVFKSGEGGREITLYEIGPGDTCILNASCILSGTPYPANAFTVEATKLLLVPAEDFRKMIASDGLMRDFVFGLLNRRLVSVITIVEEVTFGRIDRRLMDYLIEKSDAGRLSVTHQKIADDLGTSREVVSRVLKDFERKGKVILSRNLIELVNH